jgi:PAS domain S-box-containing protein
MTSDIILAVDDHTGVLEVYRKIFAAKEAKEFDVLGWADDAGSLPPLECRTYDSPKKLIEDVRSDARRGVHYPLCIVDVLMPEQSGVTTVRQLREIDPEIEIIICTADPGTVPLGVQGELGERVFFVRKPPVTDEFMLMVHTLVGYWRDRQELRRKTAFLTSLLESVSDLIFMKDARGIYMTCNKMFAWFAGRTPDEIIGGADAAFLPAERCQVYLAQDRKVMGEGTSLTYREEVKRPDGSSCLLETVKSPVYSAAGECIGLIGVGRDITARAAAAGKPTVV